MVGGGGEPSFPGEHGSQGWKLCEGRREGRGDNAFALLGLSLPFHKMGRGRLD